MFQPIRYFVSLATSRPLRKSKKYWAGTASVKVLYPLFKPLASKPNIPGAQRWTKMEGNTHSPLMQRSVGGFTVKCPCCTTTFLGRSKSHWEEESEWSRAIVMQS